MGTREKKEEEEEDELELFRAYKFKIKILRSFHSVEKRRGFYTFTSTNMIGNTNLYRMKADYYGD